MLYRDKVYEYNEKNFKESKRSRLVMGKTVEWGVTDAITVSIPKRSV